MEIQFFNILKSGNFQKERNTNSAFNDRRRLIVYNPFAKELWMLNGNNLDSEILRLTDYAIENLKKELKVRHRVKNVNPDESQQKFDYFLNLAKNPSLSEEESSKPSKSKKTTKKSKKAKKTAKKAKTEPEPEPPKPKRKPLPRVETSTIPKVQLPTPSTKSTLGIAKGDLPDEDGGSVKMVEEFQIAYIEAAGGNLLIEELEDSISEGEAYEKLVDHVKLINELVKSKASKKDAITQLKGSIEDLVDIVFSKTTTEKKAAKKTSKKTTKKKTPTKTAKKTTTKKSKKTTKKKKTSKK